MSLKSGQKYFDDKSKLTDRTIIELINDKNNENKKTEYEEISLNDTFTLSGSYDKHLPHVQLAQTYLMFSILNTILCFIIGVIALVYSIQTHFYNLNGEHKKALQNSKNAKNFNRIAFLVSIAYLPVLLLSFVIQNCV